MRKAVNASSAKAAIVARYLIGAGIIGVKVVTRNRLLYDGSPVLVFGKRSKGDTYHTLLRQLEASGEHPVLIQATLPDPDHALVIMWLKDYAAREAEWFV